MSIKIKAILAVLVLMVLGYFTTPYWTHGTKQVQVTGTVVKNGQEGSKYLVFTSEGVFENTDSWAYFKFNSSDVQAKLMQPGKYEISYYGFRVPFFSMYQNITSVQRIQ